MALDKKSICHQLKVLSRVEETCDTTSYTLEVPRTSDGKFNYRAGQFITVFIDINGVEYRRSYSLASSPDWDTQFIITVKRVPGGVVSNHLNDHVQVGDLIWCTPPAGHFCLPLEPAAKHIYLFAAGSGITPIFSLLKTALKEHKSQIHLIYQNRSADNIIFNEAINKISAPYSERFHRIDFISGDTNSPAHRRGRLNDKTINELMAGNTKVNECLFFMCGPQGFMGLIEDTLGKHGVAKNQIIKESFNIPTQAVAQNELPSEPLDTLDDDVILIGNADKRGQPKMIEAIIDGETHRVPYTNPKETILDTLLNAKLNPPYSCLDGACMACIAKVTDGLVYQKDLGILTEDNVEASECLTCQAKPAASTVKIHYETF